MSWSSTLNLWNRLFGRREASPSRKVRSRRPRRCPLLLEVLEDRTVPSVARPIIVDDWTDTDGSTPVKFDVLANDSAAAGAHLKPGTLQIVSGPQHGTARVNSQGEIVYQANRHFTGTD